MFHKNYLTYEERDREIGLLVRGCFKDKVMGVFKKLKLPRGVSWKKLSRCR